MKTIMTAVALFITVTAGAQQWHYGAKADMNFTHVQGKGIGNGFVIGFQAGGFTNITWKDKWGIQPELLFTQSNFKKADDFLVYYVNSGNVAANADIWLSYISMPLLVRYNISTLVTVLTGPQYSFLIYGNENLRGDGKKAFKNTSLSANLGVQLNLAPIVFYARYNQGISNINAIDDRYAWRSRNIQAGIAVSIK